MEILRETGPMLLGMIVVPAVLGGLRGKLPASFAGWLTFVQCIAIGLLWSTFVGEQASPELSERLVALIVDTSLAYAGASLVQWVVRSRSVVRH